MTNDRWLLIGGNGFLGTHLRGVLHKENAQVTSIYRTLKKPKVFSEHSEQFVSLAEFQTSVGDGAIRDSSVAVYLATESVPATFTQQPWREFETNASEAMRFFCRCAAVNPHIRIVFISSGGTIYGSAGDAPIDETTQPSPCSPYGLGKLSIENALSYVGRVHSMNYGILRVSNPVGIWQRSAAQGIVTAAMRCLMTQTPLPIYGAGDQVRDFVDADDVAYAIFLCGRERNLRTTVWNVGSGKGARILDVVRLIEDVTRQKLELKWQPTRSSDVHAIVLNSTKIERELGWVSKKNIHHSIEDVWLTMQARVDK